MAFTESLLLPSRGIIYNVKDFDGYVNVKAFTTKAYKDLIASNASETGLKQFIETCLVDCPIKARDMSQNDLLAILFKIRSITLGNKIKMDDVCPTCNHEHHTEWNLDDIEINYLVVDEYPIKLTLPNSGDTIKIRFVTGKDATVARQAAEKRAATFKKPLDEFLPIFNTVSLIDCNGMDIVEKADWYENLHPGDAIYIDEAFREIANTFGVKMSRSEHCSECDSTYDSYIDIGSDFFRPYANISTGVTSKTGNMGGITEKSNISE